MAILFPNSAFSDSSDTNVAPGAVVLAEGQALVRLAAAQSAGVQPSTGGAGEIFVGFSVAGTSAAPFPEGYTNKVETLLVSNTGSVKLQRTPIAGQVFIWNETTGAPVAIGSGGATVTGDTITGLTADTTVSITYKFAETFVESIARQGNVQPGGYVGAYVGQIGCASRGVIYTSEFDASVNWRAATAVKAGPNGQVGDQTLTNGATINAVIVGVPSVDYPYLVLRFSAPAV